MDALTAKSIAWDVARPGDDQQSGCAVESVPAGANLRIVQRLVELVLLLGSALAGNADDRDESPTIAPSAPASMTISS